MGQIKIGELDLKVTDEMLTDKVRDYLRDHPELFNGDALNAHINSQLPHPVYDDLPAGRFVSFLENGIA